MRHWDNIGGTPISAPKNTTANKELWRKVLEQTGEERVVFLEAYGDRAKAALVAASQLFPAKRPLMCSRTPGKWDCYKCPMNFDNPIRMSMSRAKHTTCLTASMDVYAFLIKRHGMKPEK